MVAIIIIFLIALGTQFPKGEEIKQIVLSKNYYYY